MQDHHQDGLFARWRDRLAQTLLRERTVVLLERDADALILPRERTDARAACDTRA